MSRHQVTVEVDTSDPQPGSAHLLLLDLADRAEDLGWKITDMFVTEAPEDQ